MSNITRTDAHRPSAINPVDYTYVAESYTGGINFKLAKRNAEIITAHMASTGGNYSQHEHGGNCMVCGSVNALYTSLFYHTPSNTYVRMGHDCADAVSMGDSFARKAFRKAGDDARKNATGKAKAEAILADMGCSAAWDLFNGDKARTFNNDEMTLCNMVGNLVRYGSWASEKQANYAKVLTARIAAAPARQAAFEAKRSEERATALDVPTGRVTVTGTIVKLESKDTPYGYRTVMTVKSVDGWLVWGTAPAAMTQAKGETVTFVASVERSDRDSKFGFFKRPVLAHAATV